MTRTRMTRSATAGSGSILGAVRTAILTLAAAGALAAGLMTGAVSEAAAEPVCAKHADVVRQLGAQHAETQVALGLAANGGVVEIFSTKDGATWTMVITMPNGITCMMASGESWETVPVSLPGSKV